MKSTLITGCMILATFQVWSQTIEIDKQQFVTVENTNGPTLRYSPSSGITLIEVDGLKFKDLNRNGKLDPYENWHLSVEARLSDLVSQMSIEQIAGLMLYSPHQSINQSIHATPLN